MKPSLRIAIGMTCVAWCGACAGPQMQPRRGGHVDQMHFVEDTAVEPIPPQRPERGHTSQKPAGPAEASLAGDVPGARCANEKLGSSVSQGSATAGGLVDGCELPRAGTGWLRKNRDGWATDEVVALIQWAVGQVVRAHPRTVPVVIGALSREHGGRLGRHKSHQSGRDADIGYYASNNRELPHFRNMGPGNLDVGKSWTLIGAFLATGRVQYIFMDYNVQALLYRYLQDNDTDPALLARLFQYPAGRAVRRGIIRHARGHRDHFHIRFQCAPDDEEECIP